MLEAKCDHPPSKVAFSFSLRRYNLDEMDPESGEAVEFLRLQVGRCMLNPVEAHLETAWNSALETKM
jgi:hypothetical protein